MHQDAHEFLMFIIGTITEDIEADYKRSQKEHEEQIPRIILPSNGVVNGLVSQANGSVNGQLHKGSTEEVAMTLAGGDEVRIKVNGADINTVSSQGSGANGHSHSNGHGTESIGESSSIQSESTIPKPKEKVWVQKLFEGQLTNEIKCLTCEKVLLLMVKQIERESLEGKLQRTSPLMPRSSIFQMHILDDQQGGILHGSLIGH